MNSPGVLIVKASVKTHEQDSRREHCMSKEPPEYYFGKRVLLPKCSCRWPWSNVFSIWRPPRGCINKGILDFLSEENTVCCTKLLLERAAVFARNKKEKPSDEPPTDQEHRPGDRADQAHSARLIATSIISFGCLSLVKSGFVFVYCFFE